jgi:hypothetical protein
MKRTDEKSTIHTEFINGIPLSIPNRVISGDGFHISYNNYDVSTYGSDTTALVVGNSQHFYILNGDHRLQYEKIIASGVDACLRYFKDNISLINKYSETP